MPQAFVPSIVQDHQGFIWMATRDGLCRYDGNNFKVFQPRSDGKPGITSPSLFGLSLDPQGRIWIFSDQNDIDILDPVREKFTNFSQQPTFKKMFGRDRIDAHYIDRQGRLWLSFLSNKVVCIDPATNQYRHYKRPGYFPTFSAFLQDKQGTMWMSNRVGLYRLDQRIDRFVPYILPDNDIKGIFVRATNDLFVLSSRSVMIVNPQTNQIRSVALPAHINVSSVWHHSRIVADSQGNEYFNIYHLLYRFNDRKGIDLVTRLDNQNAFRGLLIDRSDVLWGGTNKEGVLKYNLKTNLFRAMPYQHGFYQDLLVQNLGLPTDQLPPIPNDAIPYKFRYTFDQSGKMWFNIDNSQFYQIDFQTKKLTTVPFPFPVPLALRHLWTVPVTSMATDPAGRIWIMTDSLALWYEDGKWHPFQHPIRSGNRRGNQPFTNASTLTNGIEGEMLQIVVDEKAIWVATNIQGLYRIDRASGRIKQYKHQPTNLRSISSNQLFCLFDDPFDKAILWIGTFGNGLCRFDKRTGNCRRFTKQNGLPNNVIYTAITDNQGFLWIATNQGICRMDRRTFKTKIYTHEDGILEDEFNRFHYLHLPDDQIILGGLGGLTSFYPKKLRDDGYQPSVQITDIQINNQPLLPEQLPDSLPVQAINHLDLPYNQNFLTVYFAALQYNNQPKIRYRYQLVGLNKEWVETSHPKAEYTDLRWGTYVLRLNASNTSGIWSKHIRVLTLAIRPPWWATWWAILLYIGALVGVIYGLVRSYVTQQEAMQLKAIDVIKARFFTNITHEFRTPLTLILAPAEKLKQRLRHIDDRHQLDLIYQNATQLLGLINQLMELSKAEAHALQINESQGDLEALITQLIQSFEYQANTKDIQLDLHVQNLHSAYWFDSGKLERIVSNLVANALKFTPVGGKVTVDLMPVQHLDSPEKRNSKTTHNSWLQLTVTDTGFGIPADQLPRIFDRFYQVDNSSTRQQEGTGIGLALVKELVEVQSGTVQVFSKINSGSIFTVNLPYRPATISEIVQSLPTTVESEVQESDEEQQFDDAPIVLIVEDNLLLGDFIADSLPSHYQIHRALNGAEGLDQALMLVPDLVISDVLMPIMDGYTLCKNVKEDPRTSHIPVILLTAKSSVENRIEGLSLGADDYIGKPFHVQELELRVRNLLKQRQQLRDWVLASVTNPDPLPDPPAPTDPLLEKLAHVVEKHLDDASFGAEELITESGLSRMNLHRKLKALAGTSTGEFIRNYRLKRAAQLLRQGHTVSETAYLVGFEDPSYFTRTFRKVYQMTPSAFSNKN
ncbi:response regulator [Spirosoma aureum]|uniref:histidine kinase n=1 Tax=Spirosoma aureum TaxID=2692134 RepID=A0A6G9AU31_9BACT|nr:hybrid sensor histidine kinase/response regulator transcription factor [Spirosoma aureum]QIP15910.1 response regulator [Spirosoma aureum]